MKRNNRPPHPGAERAHVAETRPYAGHHHNPAGSKLLRRFCKAKFGQRVGYKKAREWYRALEA